MNLITYEQLQRRNPSMGRINLSIQFVHVSVYLSKRVSLRTIYIHAVLNEKQLKTYQTITTIVAYAGI